MRYINARYIVYGNVATCNIATPIVHGISNYMYIGY